MEFDSGSGDGSGVEELIIPSPGRGGWASHEMRGRGQALCYGYHWWPDSHRLGRHNGIDPRPTEETDDTEFCCTAGAF